LRHNPLLTFATLALSVTLLGCGTADSVDAVEGVRNGATVATGVNTCPSFAFYMVLPKQLRPGEIATVIAVATDARSSATNITYAWTATSGTFSRTDTSVTEYSCASSGAHVLRVTASDQNGCNSALALDVVCDAP
jgi:hypothetical protein